MLTGMSLDGKAFTYVNQMATCDQNPSNKREDWFECACCPPNVSRVLGHIGGYLWTATTNTPTSATVNVHLFASATLSYTLDGSQNKGFTLTQKTNYPWDGTIKFELEVSSPEVQVKINLRIPEWIGDAWEVNIILFSYFPFFFLLLVTTRD